MVTAEQITERIKSVLPDAKVKAYDMTGGGDHWRVEVVASEFADMSMVEQHQTIYRAMGEWMQQDIHALSLDTKSS